MTDPKVFRLTAPEDCESFAQNVEKSHPELAKQARRRGVELRATAYGAKTDAEREALRAIFAFEEVQSQARGKKVKASRTWQSIKRDGILPTVEKVVAKRTGTEAYEALIKAGMADFTFEAVVLNHPQAFSLSTVANAKLRLGR